MFVSIISTKVQMTNELECTWIMLMVHRKLVSQIVSNVLNVISYHESLKKNS